jgi:excisionase family DNA binding protein
MTTLLTAKEAATRLAFSTGYLKKLRLSGGSPPFIKIGRAVRYRPEDLDAWLTSKTARSTSAQTEGGR